MASIDIVVAVDEGFEQHLGVMLCSLFENNQNNRINVNVLHSNNIEKEKINFLANKYLQKLNFVFVDATKIENLKVDLHVSIATYFRLLIPNIFPNIKKALYLDADMVVKSDLTELWKTDVNGFSLAGVPTECSESKKLLNLPVDAVYFNAGVLVLNLEYWRENDISQKVIKFIDQNPDKIIYWDQDGMNKILYKKWKVIDEKWNVLKHSDNFINPAIIHYAGKHKPWDFYSTSRYKHHYYQYLKLTPWKNFTPKNRTLGNVLWKNKIHPKLLLKNIINLFKLRK